MGKRAWIYARVSKLRPGEVESRSVSEQEDEARRQCEREGWEVTRVFREPDRSASRYAKTERKEYKALLAALATDPPDVLVCWESSRAQRDLDAYVTLRKVCEAQRVLYSSSGRVYDFTRSDDRFTTALDAALDERESDKTSERVRRSVRVNAEKGRPHGRMLYGYAREYDPGTGNLERQVIDEPKAEVIRGMARAVLSGESVWSVARDLRARGIPSPMGAEWSENGVKRLLTNPGIAGLRVFQGQVIGEADWPAIISVDDHQKLVAKLSGNAGPKGAPVRREGAIRYLLTHIGLCGKDDCSNTVRARKARDGRDVYASYPCFHVSRSMAPTDERVSELMILALTVRPDGPELLGMERAASADEGARGRLAELRARLDGFYEQAADGKLSPVGLARMEARLLPQIEALEREARVPGVPAVAYEIADVDGAKVRERWDALELTQKRELIRALAQVTILPTLPGRKAFDPASVEVVLRIPASPRVGMELMKRGAKLATW